MQQFTAFFIKHWELWLAFFVILGLLLLLELRNKISGLPQLDAQAAVLLMNHEEAVVIDVRDNVHFIKGHILGAINIPLAELEAKKQQLQKYSSKPAIIVCAVGQVPQKAARVLTELGFTRLQVLKGGMNAWQNAGLPVVKK